MRKDAREIIFKLIFEYLFTGNINTESKLDMMVSDEFAITEEDKIFADIIYEGTIRNIEELKGYVEKHSIGFDIERIYKTDLAILLLAIFEIKYLDDVPNKVSINEALNLAARYCSEKSGSYINGILAQVIAEMNDPEAFAIADALAKEKAKAKMEAVMKAKAEKKEADKEAAIALAKANFKANAIAKAIAEAEAETENENVLSIENAETEINENETEEKIVEVEKSET